MKLEEEKKITKANSQDEIDLVKVFSNIVKSISNLFKQVAKFLYTFIDNIYIRIKLIVILIVIGTVLGYVNFYTKQPYYESSMTLNSDYFKGELLDNSIQNLNRVCREGNKKVLASLLHIPIQKAQKIRGLKVSAMVPQNYRMLMEVYAGDERFQNKLDSLLTYSNQSTFQLNIEVYDTSALRGLDTVLVNYIKTNNFVKKRIEVDRANLTTLRDKLVRESFKLDTLKRSLATSIRRSGDAGRSGTNNVILGERSVNPIEIYREDLQIFNQKQNIERQLALNGEIEVIEKFIPFTNPKTGSLYTNVMKGAVAGLILALLYILYLMLRDALTRLRYSLEEEGA